MEIMNFSPFSLVNSKRGDLDGYLYKGIHDSHCDYDTIGDLDDLATILTIANMINTVSYTHLTLPTTPYV